MSRDGYPLPIQTSRILLYAGYFLTGVGIGVVSLRAGILSEEGELARRWPLWLAFASLFYGAILLLVYAHHNWIADFDSPPLSWQTGYGLAFALFSAAMTFTVLTVLLAFASSSMKLLDAMRPQAYGIFLIALHLHHLAAIRRLRLFMAGLRQVRYRLRSARWR